MTLRNKSKQWHKELKSKAKWVRFSSDGLMTQETATLQRHADTRAATSVQLSQDLKHLSGSDLVEALREAVRSEGFIFRGAA